MDPLFIHSAFGPLVVSYICTSLGHTAFFRQRPLRPPAFIHTQLEWSGQCQASGVGRPPRPPELIPPPFSNCWTPHYATPPCASAKLSPAILLGYRVNKILLHLADDLFGRRGLGGSKRSSNRQIHQRCLLCFSISLYFPSPASSAFFFPDLSISFIFSPLSTSSGNSVLRSTSARLTRQGGCPQLISLVR